MASATNSMTPDTREKLQIAAATAAFTLVVSVLGALVGNYLSNRNAQSLYPLQRRQEMRERSYARLAGLKKPWSQAVQNHYDHVIAAEYYYAKYKVVSRDPADVTQAPRFQA